MNCVGACILLIEDDAAIRSAHGAVLRDVGYRVETAMDGLDALSQLTCEPDLILLDLAMPVMDGYEFLRRLRTVTKHRDTPVLVVTANHDGILLAQAQGHLRKPFDTDDLLARVSDLLRAA